MPPALRRVLPAGLCVVFLVVLGASANADGPCDLSLSKPPCSILRPLPASAHRRVDESAPECIVTVGGLGSPMTDDFFATIVDPITADAYAPRPYVEHRFGYDRGVLYPYDTYGAIALNAHQLRAFVRDLSDECFAIDVVAHSMGGAVADRAFSLGLSTSDGVLTYLPLSSPHNGAWGAKAVRLGVELSDTFAGLASALASRLTIHDPTKDAVRDLAGTTPPRPLRGIAEVRQRMVSDLIVIRRDQTDRRYDTREYLVDGLAQLEGHGGIVHNRYARAVVARTIREHAVPEETRAPAEVKAASFASRVVDHYWGDAVATAGLALADVALGAAIADESDRALLAERATAHLPATVELAASALELRDPVLPTLLKLLFASAVE